MIMFARLSKYMLRHNNVKPPYNLSRLVLITDITLNYKVCCLNLNH